MRRLYIESRSAYLWSHEAAAMIELLLALGLVGGLVGLAAAATLLPWEVLFGGGGLVLALGLAIGVPAGLYYHLLLYRALRARQVLPDGWWIRPWPLHAALSEAERPRVMRWARVGAAGFVLTILGCALVAVGSLRSTP